MFPSAHRTVRAAESFGPGASAMGYGFFQGIATASRGGITGRESLSVAELVRAIGGNDGGIRQAF